MDIIVYFSADTKILRIDDKYLFEQYRIVEMSAIQAVNWNYGEDWVLIQFYLSGKWYYINNPRIKSP